MTTPTPEQIAALVEAAKGFTSIRGHRSYSRDVVESWMDAIDDALAPFMLDPEEELVEEMAGAIDAEFYNHPPDDTRIAQARAALQVVKASPFWKEPEQ